jgi:hypothetical protein
MCQTTSTPIQATRPKHKMPYTIALALMASPLQQRATPTEKNRAGEGAVQVRREIWRKNPTQPALPRLRWKFTSKFPIKGAPLETRVQRLGLYLLHRSVSVGRDSVDNQVTLVFKDECSGCRHAALISIYCSGSSRRLGYTPCSAKNYPRIYFNILFVLLLRHGFLLWVIR